MSLPRYKRRWTVLLLVASGAIAVGVNVFSGRLANAYRWSRARQLIADRQPDQALVWLAAAERNQVGLAETNYLLARAHRHRESYQAAIDCLARAYQLGYPPASLEREKRLAMIETGQLTSGSPQWQSLLADPGSDERDVYESIVKGYYRHYNLELAEVVLATWEENVPRDPQPRFYRALKGEHDEQWSAAERWFREALALSHGRRDVRLRLANILRRQHRYREALAHYQRALDERPDAEALLGAGKCRLAAGDVEGALTQFEQAAAAQPDHYDSLLAIGELELDLGQAAAALPWLKRAAALKPKEHDARNALALALAFSGQGAQAEEHFRFAAQARVALSQAQSLMAHVAAHPNDVESRFQVGALVLEYGDPLEGLKWLHGVLQHEPGHTAAHGLLAKYYASLGDEQAAAVHRQQSTAGPGKL